MWEERDGQVWKAYGKAVNVASGLHGDKGSR